MKPINIAIACTFLVVFGLSLIMLNTQADQADPVVDIGNELPTVDVSITTSSGGSYVFSDLDLTTFTTTTIFVSGTITDSNGCTDVTVDGTVGVAVVRTSEFANCIGAPPAAVDDLNCYFATIPSYQPAFGGEPTCSFSDCTGDSDTTMTYECVLDIEHFADATDVGSTPDFSGEEWTVRVDVLDTPPPTGSFVTVTTTFEMNTLTAIDIGVDPEINYGTLTLAATSSPITLAVNNAGNDASLGLEIAGTVMTCDIGTMAVGQQKFSSSSEDYEDMPLTLSGVNQNIGLTVYKQQVSTTLATSNTYWALQVPTTGVAGACTGTVTISAISQ